MIWESSLILLAETEAEAMLTRAKSMMLMGAMKRLKMVMM